jgi:type IV secretion system protein VirD4
MSEARTGTVSDGVVLVAIASVAFVAALLWLWGGVAGLAFGHGWPHLTAAQLLRVLVRLPSRLADPRQAWPPGARAELPGAAALYATLAPVAAVALVATFALRRLAAVALGPGRAGTGARWARAGELRTLTRGRRARGPKTLGRPTAPAAEAGRIALGRRRGRVLYAENRHALLAFGPPQSGKSAAVAVPALLEWPGPAVASSIKTDLLAVTRKRREGLGTVFVFDPFGLAGDGDTHTWSPLHSARTWDGALEAAWRLAAAGETDQRSVEGGDFWAVAAEQRLAPLLFVAANCDGGIESLVRWTYGQGTRELHTALARVGEMGADHARAPDAPGADARAAYEAVRAFDAQADRTRSSIEATAQALLRAYRFTRVRHSARSCQITPDRLLDEPATLYLIGDAKASKLLRPLFMALLSEIVDRAYERATLAGGALALPLLLCLDEAGNVAPLPNLAEIASTAPSHNIQLVSIFHDLAQARARYGRQAETVVNSHRARMLLPGVADLETLRYFAGLLGDEEARELTRTIGPGGPSRSTGSRRRPLVPPELLRQLPKHRALLLYGRLAPTEVRLRLWFEDRRLRRLAE